MPKTLVTGAAGFVGRRLVERLLETGRNVAILVRHKHQAKQFRDVVVCVGDLLRPDTLTNVGGDVDQVFHLAANASLGAGGSEVRVNTVGTQNLMDALDCSRLKRFVLMSSLAAVGQKPGSRLSSPIDDSTDGKPDTPYGRSKRRAERAIIQTYDPTTTDWIILRPGLVYGPGSRADCGMNTLVDLAKHPGIAGRLDLPGSLSVVHVDDLVEVCIRCADGQLPGRQAHFVTDGGTVTFGQVIRVAAEILGIDRRLTPIRTASALARAVYDRLDAFAGISRWIPSYRLAPLGAALACQADLRRLGYVPRHDLRSGLTQTLRSNS